MPVVDKIIHIIWFIFPHRRPSMPPKLRQQQHQWSVGDGNLRWVYGGSSPWTHVQKIEKSTTAHLICISALLSWINPFIDKISPAFSSVCLSSAAADGISQDHRPEITFFSEGSIRKEDDRNIGWRHSGDGFFFWSNIVSSNLALTTFCIIELSFTAPAIYL